MIFDLSTARIFIRPGNTDLRKAVNGLTAIVQEGMALDPFNGNSEPKVRYLFCNQERKLLKAIYWDKTGFWLSQKRLEKDKFPWPADESDVQELTAEQLQMLLTGIDFFRAHQELFYKKVS